MLFASWFCFSKHEDVCNAPLGVPTGAWVCFFLLRWLILGIVLALATTMANCCGLGSLDSSISHSPGSGGVCPPVCALCHHCEDSAISCVLSNSQRASRYTDAWSAGLLHSCHRAGRGRRGARLSIQSCNSLVGLVWSLKWTKLWGNFLKADQMFNPYKPSFCW